MNTKIEERTTMISTKVNSVYLRNMLVDVYGMLLRIIVKIVHLPPKKTQVRNKTNISTG